MLKRSAIVAGFVAVAVAPAFAHAAPRDAAQAKIAGKTVTIEYGRPSLQGRDMLERATPGEPWRMGADAATTLTTDANLSFDAVSVAKGSYTLTATKDDKGAWTLNVRDKADRTKVVANVPLATQTLKESVEVFTIVVKPLDKDRGELELQWGTTGLKAAFSGK